MRAPLNGPATLEVTQYGIDRVAANDALLDQQCFQARTFAALAASRSSSYLNSSLMMVGPGIPSVGRLQIGFEQVRVNGLVWLALFLAPDVGGVEGHAIHRHGSPIPSGPVETKYENAPGYTTSTVPRLLRR